MKRCPRCNRVETDDVLVFCRADGSRLVSETLDSKSYPTLNLSAAAQSRDLPLKAVPISLIFASLPLKEKAEVLPAGTAAAE